MINKILNFVWLGAELPDDEKRNIDSFTKYNPDFEVKIWSENNLDELNMSSVCVEAINNGQGIYSYQSDIIRYNAIYRTGGFYSDTDIECFRKFPEDLFENDFVGIKPRKEANWLNPAFCGSSLNNPFLKYVIDNIKVYSPDIVNDRRSYLFGPTHISRCFRRYYNYKGPILDFKHDKVKILSEQFWSAQNPDRYCRHYFKASWIKK